jgi:hypothetical protein
MSMCSIRIEIDGVGCVPACQYPVMHSRLLSHAFIHTFILLLIILLIHSCAYQPANIQSCIPGFSVMHSSTHSFFYSFIHMHTSLPISYLAFQASQSCIPLHINYSTHSFMNIPAYQYPVMHSRLLSHTFITTFILLPIILLNYSREYQPPTIQ